MATAERVEERRFLPSKRIVHKGHMQETTIIFTFFGHGVVCSDLKNKANEMCGTATCRRCLADRSVIIMLLRQQHSNRKHVVCCLDSSIVIERM